MTEWEFPDAVDTTVKPSVTALKHCPFCGGKARYWRAGDLVKVRCADDKCHAQIGGWWHFAPEAAERWNRRAGNVVEHPCKVGDTVYWVGTRENSITSGTVESIRIDNCGVLLGILRPDGDIIRRPAEHVFLSREEAEAALEERG